MTNYDFNLNEKAEAAAMKATSIIVPSSHVPMLFSAVADLIEQAAAKAGNHDPRSGRHRNEYNHSRSFGRFEVVKGARLYG